MSGSNRQLRRAALVASMALLVAAFVVPAAQAAAPDGTVVYSTGKAVFKIASDGTGKTELFRQDGHRPCCPTISPDGTKVMFLDYNKAAGRYSLRVVNLESGAMTTPAPTKFDAGFGYWSPDGSRIAFTAFADAKRGVWVVDSDGTDRAQVWDRSVFGTVSWNFDGTKLAFGDFRKSKGRIFYQDFNTNELYRVPADFSMDVSQPTWAPDSDILAFYRYKEKNNNFFEVQGWTVHADGTFLTKFSEAGEDVYNFQWVTGGSEIIYSACCEGPSGDNLISVLPDGTGRQVLVSDNDSDTIESSLLFHSLSPDGKLVALDVYDYNVNNSDDFTYTVYEYKLANQQLTEVLSDIYTTFHSWAPDSQTMAFCTYNPDTFAESFSYFDAGELFEISNKCDADWGA